MNLPAPSTRRSPPVRLKRGLAALAALAVVAASLLGLGPSGAQPVSAASRPPVLAYYYMWFNAQSWTHTKTDLPALGAYDSTDPAIIRQQVAWAKAAGVDALIASWKQTQNLDTALAELVSESRRQGLKLVVIYQGLDVNRNPIPVSTVSADLRWFVAHYGSDPVFDLYGKPAVIWSGSWKFTPDEIAGVRRDAGAPGSLLLLGSEKDAASYAARASLFDGDAYYWSSADPLSTPGYQSRLAELAAAVHGDHGLWLAPAAVGFDARLNGGTTVVDRRNGATLRAAWSAAQATQPDGIAVISWNEFTENSYVEPSRNFGSEYLDVLATLTGAPGIAPIAPDTSPGAGDSPAVSAAPSPSALPSPAGTAGASPAPITGVTASDRSGPLDRIASIAVAALVMLALVLMAVLQRRKKRPAGTPRRRGRATWIGGGLLSAALVAVVLGWAVPNVAGANFVAVTPVLTPASGTGGPLVIVGQSGRQVSASGISIGVEVTNHYPLPVVLAVPAAAPFQAVVYQRDDAGQLHQVWARSAGDPAIEEGSDSPVADVAAAAASVPSGSVQHDLLVGGETVTFPLTTANGTPQPAGIYYVRVWAYGIASPLVPLSIEAPAASAP